MNNGRRGRTKRLPRRIVYLELLDSLFDRDGGSSRVLFRIGRDFPRVLEERWAIERWGLRRSGRMPPVHRVRLRGWALPVQVFPRVLLPVLVWATQFVLAVLRPRAGILVAYSPLMGFGAALAQLVRPSSVLVVRIIESASSRARRVYRRPFEGRILDVIERFVLRRAALVIPMAGFTRGIARTAGVPDDRIIELIYETRWSGTGIRETSDPASPPRVVYAGRLVPEKGVDLLTLAFADIAAEIPDVVLEVAGDGPERVALERLALHLGVAPRVTFHGWLPPDRMPDFLAGAMVAVLPSRVEEGFGMALIEAGLAGCALVGTDLGGTRDIVHHGRTGLLVAPNDALGIADAVIHLLSRPDEARRLGAQARIRSLEFLDARRRSLRLVQQRLESLRLDRERGLAPPGQAI